MTDLLDIAARLDACWLDIVASDGETPTLSHCGNLMSEASRALRELAVPKPIGAAPDDDRWILGYDPAATVGPPWLLVARCDGGWHDEAFYDANPTMWAPLPDPQPEPTGWRKAEGTIQIIKAWSKDIPWLTHLVEVVKPDGSVDNNREPDMATSIEDARRRAAAWAVKLSLPVVEVDDKNVVPFQRKEPTP
ncbi:hypothetical protein [Sphingobium cupriresistens]|uniref:DUF551 domain-containing protein n=1 Tax=Sphingobium cupriresistens LL01 TaxID=1420583 RepID=A0A0J7Y4W1_9SPHN|nr:hypothetical protein [Sphingobium cupriresistens]KMS58697.1 hypothetical protein V473_02615 [Sphingobium cupriresistens LL01]